MRNEKLETECCAPAYTFNSVNVKYPIIEHGSVIAVNLIVATTMHSYAARRGEWTWVSVIYNNGSARNLQRYIMLLQGILTK